MDKFGSALIIGILLLVPLSLIEGIIPAISHMATHLAEDFTGDLWVHAYIAGWILIAYGIYLFWKQRKK